MKAKRLRSWDRAELNPFVWLLVGGFLGLIVGVWAMMPASTSKIVCLGDSLTYGVTKPVSEFRYGYPSFIPNTLNLGKPQAAAIQLMAIPVPRCGKLVLMAGVNDLQGGYSPEQVVQSMKNLTRGLQAEEIFVMPTTPFPKMRAVVDRYNNLLAEWIKSLNGDHIHWIETRSKITDSDLCSDGVHLTNDGYRRLALIVQDSIKN